MILIKENADRTVKRNIKEWCKHGSELSKAITILQSEKRETDLLIPSINSPYIVGRVYSAFVDRHGILKVMKNKKVFKELGQVVEKVTPKEIKFGLNLLEKLGA